MKYFLTIAASDNSGGAGIQQDLKVASEFDYWGLSAVTAITVQNFNKVENTYPIDSDILTKQIEINIKSFNIAAVKIGAICSDSNIIAISEVLKQNKLNNIVLDTVFAPTKGKSFIDNKSIVLFKERLLPFVNIITPNKNELQLLTGQTIFTFEQGIEYAAKLAKDYDCSIYLKGGHFDDSKVKEALIYNDRTILFEKNRLILRYSHGTGCTFSSALACYLGDRLEIEAACQQASEYTSDLYEKLYTK